MFRCRGRDVYSKHDVPSIGRMECPWSPVFMKLRALYENVPDRGVEVVFRISYSIAQTGRLELSESPGTNGLQAETLASTGSSRSLRSNCANGKRASNSTDSNRGNP